MIVFEDPVIIGHKLAMRLRAAYSCLRRRSSAELTSLGMSSDQFVLLTVLAMDGSATQQELVRRCHSDTTTLGAMLALLESKGLVRRDAHAKDGRAWMVSLTVAGERIQNKAWNISRSLREELTGLIAPVEQDVVLSFLNRVVQCMSIPAKINHKIRKRPPLKPIKDSIKKRFKT